MCCVKSFKKKIESWTHTFKSRLEYHNATTTAAARCKAFHSVEPAVRAAAVEYWFVPENPVRCIAHSADQQFHHVLQERPVERFGFGGVAIVQLRAKRRFALLAQP